MLAQGLSHFEALVNCSVSLIKPASTLTTHQCLSFFLNHDPKIISLWPVLKPFF